MIELDTRVEERNSPGPMEKAERSLRIWLQGTRQA